MPVRSWLARTTCSSDGDMCCFCDQCVLFLRQSHRYAFCNILLHSSLLNYIPLCVLYILMHSIVFCIIVVLQHIKLHSPSPISLGGKLSHSSCINCIVCITVHLHTSLNYTFSYIAFISTFVYIALHSTQSTTVLVFLTH